MNKVTEIQKKVDDAMDSIVNITKATPKPFFYTRLEARLYRTERNGWERLSRLISRPAVAIATLSLVLILNGFVVVKGISAINDMPELREMAATEDLRVTSYYDIENVQP